MQKIIQKAGACLGIFACLSILNVTARTDVPPQQLPSPQGNDQNGVLMQYFHWYSPADQDLWNQVADEAHALAAKGITALWLPPAYKGMNGQYDVGYGAYDLYDLGEFQQKGSIPTKYGTKDEYLHSIVVAHDAGLKIYADVVFNHKLGADGTERIRAVRVDQNDRNTEYWGDVDIDAWVKFDFAGRQGKYSDFQWHWYHFDGVDWAQNLGNDGCVTSDCKRIYKFRGDFKNWEQDVDWENGNYDYLMGADLDLEHPEVVEELTRWGKWYLDLTNVDGFRLDAVKHMSSEFLANWLQVLRDHTGQELFTMGEYWSYDTDRLIQYLNKTHFRMSLLDAPLHLRFHQASTGNGYFDMRGLLDNTLMSRSPIHAVTFVENHDTQPLQQLESPVKDWFKPLAYAVILLREEGYPMIFHADYYGATYNDKGQTIVLESHQKHIDRLLHLRQQYAYGKQHSYLDHTDIIGWTREGTDTHPHGLAVVMSDGPGGAKRMYVGQHHAGHCFTESFHQQGGCVLIDNEGWGEFQTQGGQVAVYSSTHQKKKEKQ